MESLPDLTEAAVRPLARPQSFERRENYEEKGAVVEVVRRGNTLQAAVEGSQYEPYQTRIELATTGIVDTACSCPYDHGGICKHRVAVLLTVIRDPETVTDRPPVSDLLAEARAFIDAGDGESALTVLEAIATQLMNGEWLRLSLDDSTAIFEFFDEFSAAFSEALLTADLSETDREEWADQIAEWADELASYTRHPPFKTAVVTARRGWDDDALQQVLAGADDADLWEGERPWYADDLLEARLTSSLPLPNISDTVLWSATALDLLRE